MSSQQPELQREVIDDFPLFTGWLSRSLPEDTLQELADQAERDLESLVVTARESGSANFPEISTMAVLADFIASVRRCSFEPFEQVSNFAPPTSIDNVGSY